MSLLTSEERDKLIDLLAQLPNVETPAVRNSLLVGMPDSTRLNIQSAGIPLIDLRSMVEIADSDSAQQADGSWPILRVITNAVRMVRGSALAIKLQQLHDAAAARAVKASTAPASGATSPGPARAVNTDALRGLLTAACSASDLTTLCYDYFTEVYEEFDAGMTKSQKVQLLIDYCGRNGRTEQLLALVEKKNPYQYNRFKADLRLP
ncbi:MAG: hypothetical protein DIU80_014680 [Chloroflexota bacterium]